MKLTSDAVTAILREVLYTDEEVPEKKVPEGAVEVEGVLNKYAFHPERLAAAKPRIDELLRELPDQFHQSKGGGWSFLNACVDKNEELWGQHVDIEQLICLGIGVGSAGWILKHMMAGLPGGLPYLEVHPPAL